MITIESNLRSSMLAISENVKHVKFVNKNCR